MKKLLKIIGPILLTFLLAFSTAQAVTIFTVPQGGTGVGTLSGIIKGNGTSSFTATALSGVSTQYLDGTGAFSTPVSGGTPGGLNAQIQYNNSGVFGGISGATTDGTAVSLNAAHLLNPTINGAGTGLATLVYPNTSSSATITVPATTGTLALTSQLTSGTVTSVSGTTNRITVATGTTTPVIDISATFEALLGKVASPLSQFASTTSAQLAGVISDETGSGVLVFNNSPTFITPTLGAATASGLTLSSITGSTQCLTVNSSGVVSGTGTACGSGSGGVSTVASADGSITVTGTTAIDLAVVKAPKLTTGRTIAITGDLTYTSPSFDGSGNVTAAGTLATVNANTGSWGSATASPTFTVNGKGLITAASNTTITPAVGSITGLGSGVATFLGTPSSANLAAAVTDETGSGALVFGTSPTLTTAALGSSTATTQTPGDNSTKLATTAYVANAVLGQDFKEAAKYATTAALPTVIYSNGTSGVGATLVAVGLGALSLDGNTPAVNDRVLVKNQVSTFQNGIYNVTTVGNAGVAFVLTRSTDFNQSFEIDTGDSVFVTAGTAQSATTWAYNGIDQPTMGTDAITFVQTAGQGSFTAGNGIAITGTSIAIDTSITVDKTTAQVLTNKDLTSGTNIFPTFNQNTTGSAASLTTARTIGIVTGDATSSGSTFNGTANNTNALTLATVNTNTGSFGSSTSIPNFTVNAKGLITAAGSNVVIAPAGTLSGTTLNSTVVTSSLTSVGTLGALTVTGNILNSALTASKVVFTDASKNLTSTGIGTSAQFIKGDGSLDSTVYGSGTVTSVTAGTGLTGGTITTTGTVALDLTRANTWTGSQTISTAPFVISGNQTLAAWGLTGPQLSVAAATLTDSSTAAGATVTNVMANSIGIPTITAANATSGSKVTYTNAASVYIAGIPTLGLNTLATNMYALDVASGLVNMGGQLNVSSTINSSSFMTATSGYFINGTNQGIESTNSSTNVSIRSGGVQNRLVIASTGFVGIGSITVPGVLTTSFGPTAAAWGLNGINLQTTAQTFTDNSSAAGTITNNMVNTFGIPTLATSTNAVTYTNAATVYIAGAPAAGTHVTLTNPYSLYIAAGNTFLGGHINVEGVTSTGATGTGALVFGTSPTLTTPALGTPSALVGTNITGTGTGFTSGSSNALQSATTTVNTSSATAPSSGQVLTATSSTTATWQSPSSGLPTAKLSTMFETAGRFQNTTTGSGVGSFGTGGLSLSTTTSSGSGDVKLTGSFEGLLVKGSPTFSISNVAINSVPAAGATGTAAFFGLSGGITVASSGITFTDKHEGFKILCASSVCTLYATQANGTTETATSLTTLTTSDEVILELHVNGTSSVDYYWSKNGGTLSAATNISTNLDTTGQADFEFALSNNAAGNAQTYIVEGATWER